MDYHVHLLGIGTGKTGTMVNPEMLNWFHPLRRIKFEVYASAAGIKNMENADEEYISRLTRLISHIKGHGKYGIMAFDKFYNVDGTANLEFTSFYVPNDYVFKISEQYPEMFLPTVSVHPYRFDVVKELEKWAKRGAKIVKWLPNAMGMDPSHEKTDDFYKVMKQHNMILLSHTGDEQAVEAEEHQKYGNPLLLRKPLSYGIRVIMAHCASLGECDDLDDPQKNKVPCFDLFLRLMAEPRYKKLAFGDISAITQFNRDPLVLRKLIQRKDLHNRLVNGSDYPLPAINIIIRTKYLEKEGFITSRERAQLNEIYDYNPLLFDFVLKRTLRHPETGEKFSPDIFTANLGLQ